jgi:hypothetical protein
LLAGPWAFTALTRNQYLPPDFRNQSGLAIPEPRIVWSKRAKMRFHWSFEGFLRKNRQKIIIFDDN